MGKISKPSELRAAAEKEATEKRAKEEAEAASRRTKEEKEADAKRAKEEAEEAARKKAETAEKAEREEAARQKAMQQMMSSFSEDMVEEIQERFDIFDRVGDKMIDAVQVIDVLRSLGMNPISADVTKVVETSDLNGKRLDQLAFCSIYCQLTSQPTIATVDDMIECMKTMDKQNAGFISSATLRTLLCNLGDTLTEDQAEVMLKKYEDESGMVSYPHMVKGLVAASE